eukprot:jgi/Tetstr1/421087/TSEL_012131.t1
MRKPIEINSHVAARRGPFEPAALGRVRQHMALKFGNVVESVASNKFRIRWDDGTEPCETTNVLKLQPTGAGALPQLLFAPEVPMVSWRLSRRRRLSVVPQCPTPSPVRTPCHRTSSPILLRHPASRFL